MKILEKTLQTITLTLCLISFVSCTQENEVEIANNSSDNQDVHFQSILIDGHNDLPYQIRARYDNDLSKIDLSQPQADLHTDIPRLIEGGVDAQFWAAFIPVDEIEKGNSAHYALEQIDLIHRLTEAYPDVFELALTAEDIERIAAKGKIASLIGIEGGHAIQNSLALLRMYYYLGVRYMTLTHADSLDWADSATDDPVAGGLSEFGEEVIKEMNRIGMLVDISHVSAETMRDVFRVSEAPVIASHSSAFNLAPHPRNVPDDVLAMVKDNGGVIMINFFSGYVVPEGAELLWQWANRDREATQGQRRPDFPKGDISTVVNHIDHIVQIAGIDYVGIGSDYDGITSLPEGLEDVSTFPNLTKALLEKGYSEDDIRKILGGNFLRAFKEAEALAQK